jgi:hypothetical protein
MNVVLNHVRPLLVNNVARRLNRPERTIRYWAQIDKLHGFKIDGKSWGFWPQEVDAFCLRLVAEGLDV